MVDVENVTVATTILGEKISSPICVAPTAYHALAHHDGEKATAKGNNIYPCYHYYLFTINFNRYYLFDDFLDFVNIYIYKYI